MTGLPGLRVGWCPGALRPMRAGDGLLVRVKPRGNRLSIAQARGVAAQARHHGNGALTITARGNLQLRGVEERNLPAMTAALGALGLLDGAADGEAVRNVVSNPLAGADPEALCDTSPVVEALEHRLATDPLLWRLPGKFAWSVDAGGRVSLAGLTSDVRFEAVERAGVVAFAVALDGGSAQAVCRPDDLVAAAGRLAAAFLTLCGARSLAPHRMRDLVAACGAPAVLRQAGFEVVDERPRGPASQTPGLPVGVHRHGAWSSVAAAPAFGLLDAATLDLFAAAAEAVGAADLRVTPWRSLLAAALDETAAAALAAGLATTSLILDPADLRLSVAACVGQPACRRATTPVPVDALRLAARLPRIGPAMTRLHVSGCAKGCAHPGRAPVTLVGRMGRYDIVLEGQPGDAPVAAGLPADAVFATLSALRETAA